MRSVRWSCLTERRLTLIRLRGHRVHGSGARSDPSPNQQGTAIMTRTTDEVIDRFNRAFRERDATLLEDIISHFEVKDVHTGDEWALIRWRYVWGPGPDDSVRGVNVMRVVDGKIVEAAGYSKTAPIVAALES